VPAAALASGHLICPQTHPSDFTSCVSPPQVSSSPRNLCWSLLLLDDPKHSLTALRDPESSIGSRGWSMSIRSTGHPMSSDRGWQDVAPAVEPVLGALAFASIPAAEEPRGCQRAADLWPSSGTERSAIRHASERCRRLLIAGQLRVAQVHPEPCVTTRSPRS